MATPAAQQRLAIPVGIDLGTTNSAISWLDSGGAIKCVPNPTNKQNTHPSVVHIPSNTSRPVVVGSEAINTGLSSPLNTIYNIKRLMGRYLTKQELSDINVNYTVSADPYGHTVITVPHDDGTVGQYSPQDISSYILTHLKQTAELFFNPPELENHIYKPVYQAVVTVPADFTSQQRYATRQAAKMAGLNVLRIINEPTAAAIGFIYNHFHDPARLKERLDGSKAINLLIFDLGGGTFDVSILSVSQNGFLVRATSGNNQFGGEDIDRQIANDIKKLYVKDCQKKGLSHITAFPSSIKAMRKLRYESQRVKEKLSDQLSYIIEMEQKDWDLDVPEFTFEYKRSRLDALLAHLYSQSCAPTIADALSKAQLSANDLYQIVLVGGSTRSCCFSTLISKQLNVPISRAINPDEAVARGAAILASHISRQLAQKDINNTDDGQKQPPKTSVTPHIAPRLSGESFTELSLTRGELSSFGYAMGLGNEPPVMMIPSGTELVYSSEGQYSFFIRSPDPASPEGSDDVFDWTTPLTFYVYEGEDSMLLDEKNDRKYTKPSFSTTSTAIPTPPQSSSGVSEIKTTSNTLSLNLELPSSLDDDIVGDNNITNTTHVINTASSATRRHLFRLFEITVARQRKSLQVVSFLLKLDADGILSVFITEGEDYFEVGNVDKQEIRVLVEEKLAEPLESHGVAAAFVQNSMTNRKLLQNYLQRGQDGNINDIIAVNNKNNTNLFNTASSTTTTLPSFNKLPSINNTTPNKQYLPPPPPPRAPTFERITFPHIYNPNASSAPSQHPTIPQPPAKPPQLAISLSQDPSLNGYANMDYIFMKTCRDPLVDTFVSCLFSPSSNLSNATPIPLSPSPSDVGSPNASSGRRPSTISVAVVPSQGVYDGRRRSIVNTPRADDITFSPGSRYGTLSRTVASMSGDAEGSAAVSPAHSPPQHSVAPPSITAIPPKSSNSLPQQPTSIPQQPQNATIRPPPPGMAPPPTPPAAKAFDESNKLASRRSSTALPNRPTAPLPVSPVDDHGADFNPFTAAPTPTASNTRSSLPPRPVMKPPTTVTALPEVKKDQPEPVPAKKWF